jgi:hypothetical protein
MEFEFNAISDDAREFMTWPGMFVRDTADQASRGALDCPEPAVWLGGVGPPDRRGLPAFCAGLSGRLIVLGSGRLT